MIKYWRDPLDDNWYVDTDFGTYDVHLPLWVMKKILPPTEEVKEEQEEFTYIPIKEPPDF